jgi:hypothetical protein
MDACGGHVFTLEVHCFCCRCFTCHPAAGCDVLLCDSCDKERHAAAHLHDRQQYVAAGYRQDLPRADATTGERVCATSCSCYWLRCWWSGSHVICFPAGYFSFKPSSCTSCGHSCCFEAEPCELQPLDYIARGEACTATAPSCFDQSRLAASHAAVMH